MKAQRNAVLLLVGCLWLAAAHADVLNVLALGAKNDGSADVSAIVNANTAKGALFFPAGVYKVSHPRTPRCSTCWRWARRTTARRT